MALAMRSRARVVAPKAARRSVRAAAAPARAAVAPSRGAAETRRAALLSAASAASAALLGARRAAAEDDVPPVPESPALDAWKEKARDYVASLRNLVAVATDDSLTQEARLSAKQRTVERKRGFDFTLRKVTVTCKGQPCFLAGLGEINAANAVIFDIETRKYRPDNKVEDFFIPKSRYPLYIKEDADKILLALDAAEKDIK